MSGLIYRSVIHRFLIGIPIGFLAASALLIPSVSWAQASLEVSVVDANGRQPVANLPVELNNIGTGQSAETITDQQGKARFIGLGTSGSYIVSTGDTDLYEPTISKSIILRSTFDRSVTLLVFEKK